MHRFYAEPLDTANGLYRLEPEDARHALTVLRLRPGDAVELLQGEGRCEAVIEQAADGDVVCRAVRPLPGTEPKLKITLYQGLPKAEKMELIVQKAVELGAERIVPVQMRRCVARLDAREGAKKRERWQRIAREASKQSGRCVLPQVEAPISLRELPARLAAHDASIVPWEEARALSLTGFHQAHADTRSLGVVIGPEGGIAPEEIAPLSEAGCLPVTLGPRILRTETAGLAALSALFCLFGDMEGIS